MAKNGKKRAPLRWAKRWGSSVPGIAGKLVMLTVVLVILGLLFSMVQGIEADWLRLLVTGVVLAAGFAFFFVEGANRGSFDASVSRQMAKLEKAGHEITAKEDASCYHPLKALCGAALIFMIPFALAVVVALNSEPYTYILQDLPTWLTGSYAYREDVLGPLGAYTRSAGASALDWMRVVVRLFVLAFVSLFEDPQRMSHTIDLLAPLFIAIYPLVYTLGYMRGPAENEKLEKMNRKAKKVAVRKQQKSNLASELLGENSVPHYGHKREQDKPKKKELI